MEKLILLALVMVLAGCVSQPAGNQTQDNLVVPNLAANNTGGISLKAEKGDTVSVDYVGTLDDGTMFDASIQAEAVKGGLAQRPSYEPLTFTVGAGQMIKGFDDAVVGMQEGEEKSVRIPAAEAYGERRDDLIVEVPIDKVSGGTPQVGSRLTASNGMPGRVIEVTNTTVKVDFNNEMAGKALNFRIIMRKITKAGA
jgi:FKBP-type peptidyl-prolyl cis-trans isomerase SlyD